MGEASDAARRVASDLLARVGAGGQAAEGIRELVSSASRSAQESLERESDTDSRVAQPLPVPASGGVLAALLSRNGCLPLARGVWADLLRAGDTVVDATCGNGQDSSELARLLAERAAVGSSPTAGRLVCMDVQLEALANSRERLASVLASAERPPRIELLLHDHATFPPSLEAGGVRLIVYNLGYLPGGERAVHTETGTTLRSLTAAQSLVSVGGAISVMCYPGHAEGVQESDAVRAHLALLDKAVWRVLECRFSQSPIEKFLIVAVRRGPDPEPGGVRRKGY